MALCRLVGKQRNTLTADQARRRRHLLAIAHTVNPCACRPCRTVRAGRRGGWTLAALAGRTRLSIGRLSVLINAALAELGAERGDAGPQVAAEVAT